MPRTVVPNEVSDTSSGGGDTSSGAKDLSSARSGRTQRVADLGVEVDGALHRLVPVAEVEALVLGVGVGVRVLDADEQRRYATQLPGERFDEGNAPSAPDRHRVGSVALLQ